MNFEIVLCDIDDEVCTAFRSLFRSPLVSVEQGDLLDIAADAYVSPANSHGIMDGGFDRRLRERFPGIESRVQARIDEWGGLLPVGKAIVVDTLDYDVPFLICAPTMVVPSRISGTRNVHAAMRAILTAVSRFNERNDDGIQSVAIPGLGTGIGRMAPAEAVAQMRDAFEEFLEG